MKYQNHAVVIRLPQPGALFFPEEKVVNEVAIMRFLIDQTSISVTFILHSGTEKESPLELSPFIMMDYIQHETNMYDALSTPGCPKKERGILDPKINDITLEFLYGQLVYILLQLSKISFPRIGSLTQVDDFTWEVSRRPLSMNMNGLVRLGGLPRSKLPDSTFNTISCYLEALADLNIQHLLHQRNDAVESADDSFAFDAIYWQKIDPLFFTAPQSPETAWKERLGLLGEREIEEMEQLVAQKLEEMKTRILKWDPDEYTVEAIAKADGAH